MSFDFQTPRTWVILETSSKHWRRRGGRQPEEKFPALKLISIITWSAARPPRTVAAARKVGFAASRDGHFIFRFVAPKIHGIIYFLKEMFIDAHICILFANI